MVVEPTVCDDIHRLVPLILTRLVNKQMSVVITIASANLSARDKHFIRIVWIKGDLPSNVEKDVSRCAEDLLEDDNVLLTDLHVQVDVGLMVSIDRVTSRVARMRVVH